MKLILKLVTSLLLFTSIIATAQVQQNFNFSSSLLQQRFQTLLSELRCVVCQNQSLSESNAPLAQDLKKEVYTLMIAGFSDQGIKHYLVQRYGDYILFKPRMNRINFILWLGPMLFMGGAFLILYLSIRRAKI